MKYVAIFRGRSACRIPEEAVLSFVEPSELSGLNIKMFTRYTHEALDSPIPRELCAELVWQSGESFVDARQSMEVAANSFSAQLAVATNAPVRHLEMCFAYDASPELARHPIFRLMWPLETGLPHGGRKVPLHEAIVLMEALSRSPHSGRIGRACVLYNESLLRLRPGHEVYRMMFLWMAVEALTKAALQRECQKAGTDDAGLALSWGLVAAGATPVELKAGKRKLDGEVRRRLIFHGDAETMKSLRSASDGMEHSFLEPKDVHKMSVAAVARGSEHIRLAILELLEVPEETIAVLTSWPYASPKNDMDMMGFYEGEMLSPTETPNPVGPPHPDLEVKLNLRAWCLRSDGSYGIGIETETFFSSGAGTSVEGRAGALAATPDRPEQSPDQMGRA